MTDTGAENSSLTPHQYLKQLAELQAKIDQRDSQIEALNAENAADHTKARQLEALAQEFLANLPVHHAIRITTWEKYKQTAYVAMLDYDGELIIRKCSDLDEMNVLILTQTERCYE